MNTGNIHPIFAEIITQYFSPIKEIRYWWCENCQLELCNENVTFEETCDRCRECVELRIKQ